MALATVRPRRPRRSLSALLSTLLLLGAFLPVGPAHASLLEHLDGNGNFHTYVDVVNRWRDETHLDVAVLVEVANADLSFETENGGQVARLRLEVDLIGPDGQVVTRTKPVRTRALPRLEAAQPALFQVFGMVLENVPFRSGRLVCRVYDVNRQRKSLASLLSETHAVSSCAAQWYAEDGPRAPRGLALGDPLFLAHAPLSTWNPQLNPAAEGRNGGWVNDFMHPSRRYGLEQDHLQLFLQVWPPAGGIDPARDLPGVLATVISRDMSFAMSDTLELDERGRLAMASGQPAGLFYEVDVNLLPEGAYHLSLAPLGGEGRPVVAGFEVVWRLEALTRHRDMVLGEGSIIFEDAQRRSFEAGSPADQVLMLEAFWAERDPDPETPLNEAYVEFQYRLGYVRQFLGGIGPDGPLDDRGLVFVLLGPPDDRQREVMPMNFRDQDDARIKVFERFALDREGVWAKGSPREGGHSIGPYEYDGGIPMPYSRRAESQRQSQVGSPSHNFGYELWKYDAGGRPLFDNRFSRSSMGSRFLFIDRTGAGHFSLESSNVMQGEE